MVEQVTDSCTAVFALLMRAVMAVQTLLLAHQQV
jgi:hypothetical protein